MTAADEYVPSEDEMVTGLVQIPGEPAGMYRHVHVDEMKRGLARVRRDAAREALTQMVKDGKREGMRKFHLMTINAYRDQTYPEEAP